MALSKIDVIVPIDVLLFKLITIVMISMVLIPVGAVTVVRHAVTVNCQDPRQFCHNLAPYSCCSFPDIGAKSLEFAQVMVGNVMMGFQPDIRSIDMCKYLDRWAVGDGSTQRYCMTGIDYTGGMWRPSLPSPPALPGSETTVYNDNDIDSLYPWSHCNNVVNATDIDIHTYESLIGNGGSVII